MHVLNPAPASGYLDRKRRHPALLTTAIVLHAGLLAAILTYNPEVIGIPKGPTVFIPLDPTKPPPPPREEPKKTPREAKPQNVPDRPEVLVPTPSEGPVVERWPDPPPPVGNSGTGEGPLTKAEPAPPVVTIAELDPRYRGDVQPPYPPSLERMEVEGKVTVRLQVGPDGRVTSVELVRADDPGFFATTRDWALKRWRFKPATRDGVPVASTVVKTVSFRIVRA